MIAGLTMTAQKGALLTFPVVYEALLEEFGMGRGETAGIYSMMTLMIGLTSPLEGFLLDRFGPRRLFVGGALLPSAGIAATSVGAVAMVSTVGRYLVGLASDRLDRVPDLTRAVGTSALWGTYRKRSGE